MITPGIDHIALTVPDLDEQVDRLTSAFGMVVEVRFEGFALIADPASGLKIELSRSDDSDVHFRHLGSAPKTWTARTRAWSRPVWSPVRRPTGATSPACTPSFLKQPGGLEVQLVKYD